MKCSNCGADMQEGVRFCPVCGQAAESTESAQNQGMENVQDQTGPESVQNQINPETVQQDRMAPNPKKKKKSTGFKVGIAAAVVAVLVVGVAAGAKVAGTIRKMTMSPAKYYQYVEEKNRDAGGELIFGSYDAMRKNMVETSGAKNINMKMEVSDTAKSLLSLTGMDFSKFENLELNLITSKEKEALSNQIQIRGNGNDLLTVKTHMDSKDEKMYYQIPELSKSYLDFSAYYKLMTDPESALGSEDDLDIEGGLEPEDDLDSDISGNSVTAPGAGVSSMLFQPFNYDKIFMETKTLKTLYERYTDIFIKSAKNVTKSEGTCEAEGISKKADKYTVTLNGKEVAALIKELLETLKKDAEIKAYIENAHKEAYQEFTEDIGEVLESVDTEIGEEEFKLVMEVLISSDEKIIGRTLNVMDGEEKAMEISIASPQDGDKFGFELGVIVEGEEYVKVNGKGTLSGGVMNGDFSVSMPNILVDGTKESFKNFLVVKIEDYDISKLAKGEAKGTFTYSTEAVAALANYSLKVESESNSEGGKGIMYVMAGKDALATIYVTMNNKAKAVSTKPSDGDTVYDADSDEDMLKYQSEMDVLSLLTDIQDKLGIDLSGLIGAALGGSGSSGDNYLEDDSDLFGDDYGDIGDIEGMNFTGESTPSSQKLNS